MWTSIHFAGPHWVSPMFRGVTDEPDVDIEIWIRINRDTQTWTAL